MARYSDPLLCEFQTAIDRDEIDLAATALTIAKLEYPSLDPARYRSVLDELGERARARVGGIPRRSVRTRIAALNGLIFEDEGFSGNHGHYDDFRNSFLNAVLERRLGIPITLALVYMEVAARAGIEVQGVAFPGHFLMRAGAQPPGTANERTRVSPRERSGDSGGPAPRQSSGRPEHESKGASERVRGSAGAEPPGIVLDPFDAGVELNVGDCRKLLARHLGSSTDHAPFDSSLLRPCTRRHMVARMLNNLKRTYLELRSFHHARRVTDLLLALEPMLLSELRDRALLAYHLDDHAAALRDLEDYLRLRVWKDDSEQEDRKELLDHVKTLKRKTASLN